MERASRYYNMNDCITVLEDEPVPDAPPQPHSAVPLQNLEVADQEFLDRILQTGNYCPSPKSQPALSSPTTLQQLQPAAPPLQPLAVQKSPDTAEQQPDSPLVDPSDLLPILDVTAQEARRTVSLHFETASVHTSHLFELAATGGVAKLIASMASKAAVDYPNPPPDQLLRAKSQPLVLSFSDCSFPFVHFLKKHYKLRSEEEIESIFGFPNFIQGDEKKIFRIMIERWTKSPSQHLLFHESIPRSVEDIALRGVELKGRLILTGKCPAVMRASALSLADYLKRLDGPVLIICHYLVVPSWDLLIHNFKKPETPIELVSPVSDSSRTSKKIDASTVLEHGIYVCSANSFHNFCLPQTKNLTVIVDGTLPAIIQNSPAAIKQFRTVHRCLVIFPDFSRLKRIEKDRILSELVHPDIQPSSSYFELIEKLHVVDTDEEMFSETEKFRIEVGVFTSELDSERIEEMAEISQILEQRDKQAVKQRYEQMFGNNKLALLEKNLRSHFEQATDKTTCRKHHVNDVLKTPSYVDIEFRYGTQLTPSKPSVQNPHNLVHQTEHQIDTSSPNQEAALITDGTSTLSKAVQEPSAKNLIIPVCGTETPNMANLLQPTEVRSNDSAAFPGPSTDAADMNKAQNLLPVQLLSKDHLPVYHPDRTAAKDRKSMQKRPFQVGDLEEYISNHMFECAKGALQFRMLSLNSETKISSILEILEQRIVGYNKRKVIIWVHHQHVSERIHTGCLQLLQRLEFDHNLRFVLHSIFSKQARMRMNLIARFREESSPCIAIIPVLTQKEVLLGIKFDLMIFSELIHQTEALFEAANLAKLCGDRSNKELLFFRSNLSFDLGLWMKYQKYLQEEFGTLLGAQQSSQTEAFRERRIDLKANRGYELIASKEYPVYLADIDSFFDTNMLDSIYKRRTGRYPKLISSDRTKRSPDDQQEDEAVSAKKHKRTSKQAMDYKDKLMSTNPIHLANEQATPAPKYRYRSKTVKRFARRFEESLKMNPETFQISFPNSLDNSLWNFDILASGDSRSLLSVEQSDYSGEDDQEALFNKRSVKSVLVSANSLGLNEQTSTTRLLIRL